MFASLLHVPRRLRRSAPAPAFTLVEVIVVLLLLGLLSVAAVSALGDGEDRALPYEFSTLKTHIRFAQARAMGRNTPYGIRCQDGAYWLFTGSQVGTAVRLPGQAADTVTLQSSVTPASFTLAFNGRGQAFSAAVFTAANALGEDQDVTLTLDGESLGFTVTAHTGYIP
ncbi:GspH/FimT family pseudopilin [Desulfocurvus sp.]|jgi:prepilin-type N-terminal cleavage/methylation domain-containing protein|uniref:GspH/FimT family pseudopilin n=1 Tax=Desulfocurvus sp. TaxID=2871698 RepID=UPI0025BAA02E|nr:GspH/FimT family pseudopilin [Desulfocurvus sp.]MCK9239951.1 GspH/FimT family pseudopilin [Desulfocurvus sp.]